MSLTLRPTTEADGPLLRALVLAAFGPATGARREHLLQQAAAVDRFVLLEDRGRPVATARVQIDALSGGPGAVFRKADLGVVAVWPDQQGRGYGSALLRAVTASLEGQAAVARLGGLVAFYTRFGFVPFPRRRYLFRLEVARAGRCLLQPSEYLAPQGSDDSALRPYDPVRDAAEVARLRALCPGQRLGALLTSGAPVVPGEGWVYRAGDHLAAIVRVRLTAAEASIEGECDLEHRGALAAVVRRGLLTLCDRSATEVVGLLPVDPAVERELQHGGVGFILQDHSTAPAGNLLRLISLRGLLTGLLPAWRQRLAATLPWHGVLQLQVGDQAANLGFSSDGIGLASDPPQTSLALPADTFLLAALGYRSLAELLPGVTTSGAGAALAHLLTRQPTVPGPLG